MEESEYKHWAEVIAEEAISTFGDNQVVCAGWSPSGEYHIGNSREAVTCYAIHSSLLEKGADSKFVFVIDDFDPLDKIPQDLKKYSRELRPYLGHPLSTIPDFTETYEKYSDYFAAGAIKAMEDFGFDTEFVYASDLYKSHKYDDFLQQYIDHSSEIDKLFEDISGSPLNSYVSVICNNCGNMKTPVIDKIEGEKIYYTCTSDRMFRGCDDEGFVTIDDHSWKLKWRLDWPARQTFLGVTVEPSGKDHSVSGGSVDTAIAIHKKILDNKPPILERYGFITIKGKKLSGSRGGALPASKIAEIMPASAYLYLVYRSDLLRDINFNPETMEYGSLLDEFDDARRMAQGVEFEGREREVQKLSTAAQLAMFPEERGYIPADVRFEELTLVFQTSLNDRESTISKFEEMRKIPSEGAEKDLERRLTLAEKWLNELAPDSAKIQFLDEPPEDIDQYWTEEIKTIWLDALEQVDNDTTSDQFTSYLRQAADSSDLHPKKYYQAFYQLVSGKSSGPNASNLVLALGTESLINKINNIPTD